LEKRRIVVGNSDKKGLRGEERILAAVYLFGLEKINFDRTGLIRKD
jgi:hypothetical protein